MSTIATPGHNGSHNESLKWSPGWGRGRDRTTVGAWVLLGASLCIALAGVPPATFWARLFFGVVLLAGGVAAAGLAGPRARLAAALAAVLLVSVERIVERAVPEPPSPQWTRALQGPDQRVQHEMVLPFGDPSWEAVWRRATTAAVFVCARSPLEASDGLELAVNDVSQGTLVEAQAFGPRPEPTLVGFYRIPVDRALLERRRPAQFVLRRLPGATPRPIAICGTFTYRPTAGLDSSRFFDGVSWWHPGLTQQGRFVVELRLEDARMSPLWVGY